ncbi:hypothetical protein L0244_32895 [bacterium]|nr:hypothetical protein [bacterium]
MRRPICILCKHRRAATAWFLCVECDARLLELDETGEYISSDATALHKYNLVVSHTLGVLVSEGVVEDTFGLSKKRLHRKEEL